MLLDKLIRGIESCTLAGAITDVYSEPLTSGKKRAKVYKSKVIKSNNKDNHHLNLVIFNMPKEQTQINYPWNQNSVDDS